MLLAAVLHTSAAWSTAAEPPHRQDQQPQVRLNENSVLRFSDVATGRELLAKRDDYIRQLSPFDRQVRPATEQPVSEAEFTAFLASHVVPWTAADVQKLTPLIEDLAKKIAAWKLPLPPVVELVKTSGREEGAAAYCRGNALVLPANLVNAGTNKLANILPHELFHVLSNQNRELRKELYATLGFQPTEEVAFPPSLAARKITNPDAPLNNFYISVVQDGRPMDLVPVLFSNAERYDPARGGNLFAYLTFKLMVVENVNGKMQPALVGGEPELLDPASVPDFHRQIGANTKYIIHPEEVLADNFVYLLNGRIDLPTPRVVEAMGKVLQGEKP